MRGKKGVIQLQAFSNPKMYGGEKGRVEKEVCDQRGGTGGEIKKVHFVIPSHMSKTKGGLLNVR